MQESFVEKYNQGMDAYNRITDLRGKGGVRKRLSKKHIYIYAKPIDNNSMGKVWGGLRVVWKAEKGENGRHLYNIVNNNKKVQSEGTFKVLHFMPSHFGSRRKYIGLDQQQVIKKEM